MYKCYGCGETKQDKSPIKTIHTDNADFGLNKAEVKMFIIIDKYRYIV